MPGEFHEILVKLIQDRPVSVAWLLGRAGIGQESPCVGATDRSSAVGSPGLSERRADGVVQLDFEDRSKMIVICEVQNDWSDDKYFRLPGYMSRAFEDHKAPVSILMVCRTDYLAKRFKQGIEMGPGSTVAVATVGPAQLPDLGSDDHPPNAETAVLSAVLRKQPKAVPEPLFISTLDRWLGTIEDPGRAADYAMYLLTTLAKEPATLLEALMKTGSRPYHSEFTDQLREEGREKGREEGREEGAVAQTRAILLKILQADGPVSDERRAEIETCSDLAQLDAWITERIKPAKG